MSERVKSGIYIITNSETGDCYIGSSINVQQRLTQHRYLLRIGRHHSRLLQDAWSQYGEDAFLFDILEVVPDPSQLITLEQRYLDERQPAYNPARIALRNGAGITTSPDKLERQRESARKESFALMALYDEASHLRAFAARDDDIMKVLTVAHSLSVEDRLSIEESEDLAAHLYKLGMVSGHQYLDFLTRLSNYHQYAKQSLADDWRTRGIEPHEVEQLSRRLHAYVTGIEAGSLPPAMTLTELALNTLANTVARELHVQHDSQGFRAVSADVDVAGRIAGDTRRQIEEALGRPVVSPRNMIQEPDGGLWRQLPPAAAATAEREESASDTENSNGEDK